MVIAEIHSMCERCGYVTDCKSSVGVTYHTEHNAPDDCLKVLRCSLDLVILGTHGSQDQTYNALSALAYRISGQGSEARRLDGVADDILAKYQERIRKVVEYWATQGINADLCWTAVTGVILEGENNV